MARFVDEVKTAIQASACAVLSANEFVNGAVGLVSPASRDFFNGYVNATRRLIGCNGPDNELPASPFAGGQCQGVNYTFRYAYTASVVQCNGLFPRDFTSGGTVQVTGVFGPVSTRSIAADGCPNGVASVGGVEVLCFNEDGSPRVVSAGAAVFGERFTGFSYTTFEFVRVDGQPDNCGDPPAPPPPPPTNINIDVDITYEDDDDNPITINLPITYAPITVNFDGSLSVPLSFDFGGFTFDGSLNLDPDLSVNINLPSLPRGTGDPVGTLPPGNPVDNIDIPSAEQKIIGLVVTSTIDAQSNITTIATTGMPSIAAPRLGSVKFAYSFGATTFWSNDVDIKGQRVFVPCPFSQGADAAVASPVPGVSLSFVEIRGFPLATVQDVS